MEKGWTAAEPGDFIQQTALMIFHVQNAEGTGETGKQENLGRRQLC